METWCGIYDGEDIGAVVRGRSPCDDAFNSMENLQEATVVRNQPVYSMLTIDSPSTASVDLKSPTRDNGIQVVDGCSSAIKTDSNGHSLHKLPGAKKKQRKSEERRVMCVPMAEGSWNKQGGAGVLSDLWSWRKYGQKPIKGSPYPRGYYRCSGSKGCPARKQIERSRTDPTMLLITYSAEHNHVWNWSTHRNALARSSRQNSFHDNDKKVQAWSVPNTADVPAPSENNDDGVSSLLMSDKWGHNSHFQTNCVGHLDEGDQYYSGLDVLSTNHILDDYIFADLGELPEPYPTDSIKHSGEEDVNSMFNPFNLFG